MILIVFGLIVIAVATAILYARWNYGTLEATGVPVVPPGFILGSDPDLHNLIISEVDRERGEKYGRVWGLYEGRAPQIFVNDAELIRSILVKDFDNFHNRRNMDFGPELFFETLDVLPYEKWKAVRQAITPSFTSGKIRMMSETMKEAAVDCIKNLHKQCGNADAANLNAKRIFVGVTTDIIARCAFGMKLDSLNDPDCRFVKELALFTQDTYDPNYTLAWTLTYPILAKLFPMFPEETTVYFANILRTVMNERRKSGSNYQGDLVNIFNDLIDKVETDEFKRLGITEKTAVAQSLTFLFAGFDTLATTLTMLCYRLVTNPDKQEKLLEEIDNFLAKHDGDIDHDTQKELPYLTACISETLRMTSPLTREERVCGEDWKHEESGLVIKKGTVVMIPNYAVHYNEKYWPEPDSYQPERFLAGNKDNINQYTYLPFGHGPRNCAGMRFAREEMNLVMVKILKEFRLEALPETKVRFKPGRQFLVQYEPVMMRFIKRK